MVCHFKGWNSLERTPPSDSLTLVRQRSSYSSSGCGLWISPSVDSSCRGSGPGTPCCQYPVGLIHHVVTSLYCSCSRPSFRLGKKAIVSSDVPARLCLLVWIIVKFIGPWVFSSLGIWPSYFGSLMQSGFICGIQNFVSKAMFWNGLLYHLLGPCSLGTDHLGVRSQQEGSGLFVMGN